MKKVSIIDIFNGNIPINTEVTLSGWIRTRRTSKSKISFLNLYDGSCLNSLQIIADKNLHNYKNEILHLTSGCSIMVIGKIIKSIGKKQDIELIAKQIKILGWIHQPNSYPISTKQHSMEYLRNFSHLRARTHIFGSITRIRHVIFQSIHNFMNEQGFIWIPTPIITASDTEGNSKMFCVSEESNNKPTEDIDLSYNLKKKIKNLFLEKRYF